MNTVAPAPPMSAPVQFPDADTAWFRVLKIQTKLHQWASEDSSRRFDDLFNLVCHPAFLALAWDRVRGNKGARTAGVDGQTAFYVETVRGREVFLAELRADLKSGSFSPLPVRERMIPKTGGKLRRESSRRVRRLHRLRKRWGLGHDKTISLPSRAAGARRPDGWRGPGGL